MADAKNENDEPTGTCECSIGWKSVNFGLAHELELALLPYPHDAEVTNIKTKQLMRL